LRHLDDEIDGGGNALRACCQRGKGIHGQDDGKSCMDDLLACCPVMGCVLVVVQVSMSVC
jgi:hypothetical protein